jgi:D-glycero-D-manno-heptose 1,7-bisphosphate phosphatase
MKSKSFLIDRERWTRLNRVRPIATQPALFLDRDGVMIEDRDYLCNPTDVELIPGCAGLLRWAVECGLATVVVTNQSGIGRGLFGWRDYELVEQRMLDLLALEGAGVDAVLANAAVPGAAGPGNSWRKPRPGMLLAAAEALNIDLKHSIVVGDKATDLAAGLAAGLQRGWHVSTGHGKSEVEATRRLSTAKFQVNFVGSIADVLADLVTRD